MVKQQKKTFNHNASNFFSPFIRNKIEQWVDIFENIYKLSKPQPILGNGQLELLAVQLVM